MSASAESSVEDSHTLQTWTNVRFQVQPAPPNDRLGALPTRSQGYWMTALGRKPTSNPRLAGLSGG